MKHHRLVRLSTKGRRKVPRKPKFVAEVSITSHSEDGGKVVGSAKIEQLSGTTFIAHIDASNMTAETLRRGFSLGEFEIPEVAPYVSLEKSEE